MINNVRNTFLLWNYMCPKYVAIALNNDSHSGTYYYQNATYIGPSANVDYAYVTSRLKLAQTQCLNDYAGVDPCSPTAARVSALGRLTAVIDAAVSRDALILFPKGDLYTYASIRTCQSIALWQKGSIRGPSVDSSTWPWKEVVKDAHGMCCTLP